MVKIGAMSICLARLLEEEEPSNAQLLQAAAQAGLDGVEFYQTHWKADLEQAAQLKALAQDLGVEIFALGSGVRLGHADGRRAQALETLKTQVRTAAAAGAGVVTFPAIDSQPVLPGKGPEEGGAPFFRSLGPLIEQVRELAAFAEEHGVRVAVLNHGYFVSLSWHQEWVVRLAEMPNVGVCLDPGNYLFYECEDPVAATRRLAGMVFNVRLGDWKRRQEREVIEEFQREGRLRLYEPAIFGQGEVDYRACLELLRQSGYQRYLSLKSAGASPGGPAQAFRQSLENARALVALTLRP
jgi:sugar phosphate isomerase/epimerase